MSYLYIGQADPDVFSLYKLRGKVDLQCSILGHRMNGGQLGAILNADILCFGPALGGPVEFVAVGADWGESGGAEVWWSYRGGSNRVAGIWNKPEVS